MKSILNETKQKENDLHLNEDVCHDESSHSCSEIPTPTLPLDLPHNLGELVKKALVNLKENNKLQV